LTRPRSSSEPALDRTVHVLVEEAAGGDARAVARLISLVEAGGAPERAVSRVTFPRGGRAWVVGVTGAPGVGKSTLVDRLVALVRGQGERVAVVAVDPSSPFSGGAVLGDRVRMQDHATDAGVYIRSMATRGELGGLARAALGAVRVLDAVGWPWILVETVGTGQVELDVAAASDTTLVVVTPGWGDAVQTAKAGLLELADVLVVNQADRPGADEAALDLELALDLAPATAARPPVVRASALAGEGVAAVWGAIGAHRASLEGDGAVERMRAQHLDSEVRRLVVDAAARGAAARCEGPVFDRLVDQVVGRRLDPLTAAAQVAGGASAGGEARGAADAGDGGDAATNPTEQPHERQ
jgi:LAO/AO transport system kinase